MLDHVPTVRSRQLGGVLARAMQETGRNGAEMAELLGWSASKISRLLSGKRPASTVDVSAFLALCRVVGDRREEVLRMARDVYTRTWWQDYGDRLPVRPVTLTDNEALATTITCYDNAFVPDLGRVPAYTRAVLRSEPTVPPGEIDDRVAETTRRQRILRGPRAPRLRIFLDEYALTRTGAGDAVMAEQARHLLWLTTDPDSRVEIRVLPDGRVHQIGPFTLLTFADLPPVVYLEHATSAAFVERDDTIATYEQVVAALSRRALDAQASRTWLADLARRRDPASGVPTAGPSEVVAGQGQVEAAVGEREVGDVDAGQRQR